MLKPPPEPYLYHHTGTVIANKLYLYGGMMIEGNNRVLKKLNSNVFEIHPQSLTSKVLTIDYGDIPPPRRNHIAIAIQSQKAMFIHGGLSKSNQTLKDSWLFYPCKKI
jgi:hypothetical protein